MYGLEWRRDSGATVWHPLLGTTRATLRQCQILAAGWNRSAGWQKYRPVELKVITDNG